MEQEFRLRTSQISYYKFFLLTQISYDRNPGQGLGEWGWVIGMAAAG